MRKRIIIELILLVLTLISMVGCAGRGMISVDRLRPVIEPVMQRHDTYVQIDPDLSIQDRADFLRSTELLHEVLDAADGK